MSKDLTVAQTNGEAWTHPDSDPASLPFPEDSPAMKALLKLSSHRTDEDVTAIFCVMRSIKAFSRMSNFILSEVCRVLTLQEFEPNRAVFKQGDPATSWYVILKGSVVVEVQEPTGETITVSRLGPGDGFGELALVNSAPRSATILTQSRCFTVAVDKEPYSRIMKFIHKSQLHETVIFLRSVQIFSDWTMVALMSVASTFNFKTYEPGEVIMMQNMPIKEVCFIRSGQCMLSRVILTRGRRVNVVIGELNRGEYFGEEAILEQQDNGKVLSHYTVSAHRKSPVEIGMSTVYDCGHKFGNVMAKGRYYMFTDTEVRQKHDERIANVKWQRIKRKELDLLMKEKTGNPNATASSVLGEQSINESRLERWKY
ncbi:cyclic nucleotide-binding-like protein [Polychytrium aggregatum]|uniref:cyclic nucleotide-binding-like protein n=1 Tax=Polychytrium aggregatum TaxID=110093 RepID=UPI0022FE5869|nr:cyclic nucleotide-binding-like protein [Polychytrium aggregatum]KAI9207816.1 cyclic nucleotide-binding-like protein [Polychytrium aggregatum]